jgi:hypothetical protein
MASNEQNWRKYCQSYQIMRENRRLTVRSIAEQVHVDREAVRKILTEDLDMRKVWTMHLLTQHGLWGSF